MRTANKQQVHLLWCIVESQSETEEEQIYNRRYTTTSSSFNSARFKDYAKVDTSAVLSHSD